jgi:dTDP-4-dehydrorhamnose 3,5-epimerase
MAKWLLEGASKDQQSITSEWEAMNQTLIAGVRLREVKNVLKANGSLTEIYRRDWKMDDLPVNQVFQVTLLPQAISAWHAHEVTTDRLFVHQGIIRIILYDGREASPTYGVLNEFKLGVLRPGLLLIPPKVWHGVQNIGESTSALLNLVDHAYTYEDPDHWRLPHNTQAIPFHFSS